MAALSACNGSQSQATEEGAPRTEPESIAVTDPEVVLGAWDVVSFEGYAPRSRMVGSTRAAYADFDADGVRLRMECNYAGRRGAVRAGVFEVAADAGHMQTLMGCGADGNAREARYFAFFDQEPSIKSLGSHRLLFEAGDQTLVLEHPEVRRLAFTPTPSALTGTWQLLDITHYVQGRGSAGTGLSELPGHLALFDGTLRHTACPELRLSYELEETGRFTTMEKMPSDLASRCPALRVQSSGMPSSDDAIAVLYASPLAELSEKDGLLLSTEEFGLLRAAATEPGLPTIVRYA